MGAYNPIQPKQLNLSALTAYFIGIFASGGYGSGVYIPPNSPYDQRGNISLNSGQLTGSGSYNINFSAQPSFFYPPAVVGPNTITANISGFTNQGFVYFLGGAPADNTSVLYWRAIL